MAKRDIVVGQWSGHGVVAATPLDRQNMFDWFKPGDLLEISKYRPRSDKQNRTLHAILNIAEENSPDNWTPESIKSEVKLRNGWIRGAAIRRDGTVYAEVRSTAEFSADEMEKFTDQIVEFVITEACPGMEREGLIAEMKRRSELRKGLSDDR